MMATRKKKSEEKIIAEVSKLIAEETLQATDAPKKKPKKKNTEELSPNVDSGGWPKINQGSHLTVKTFEDGHTELVWDDEALARDVQNALTEYENSVKVNTVKTTKRKKKNEA
jgi:hypothetical protein